MPITVSIRRHWLLENKHTDSVQGVIERFESYVLGKDGWQAATTDDANMKKIASITAILTVLSTGFALAQSNPNMQRITGTAASQWAWQHSVTGNPNNPSPADYYRYHRRRR